MSNLLISIVMVLAVALFVLMLIGAAMMLGQLFAGVVYRLTRRTPTAADRELERLLAETNPNRR